MCYLSIWAIHMASPAPTAHSLRRLSCAGDNAATHGLPSRTKDRRLRSVATWGAPFVNLAVMGYYTGLYYLMHAPLFLRQTILFKIMTNDLFRGEVPGFSGS